MRIKLGLMFIVLIFGLIVYTPKADASTIPALSIETPQSVEMGELFEAKVNFSNAQNIEGLDLSITFNSTILTVIDSNTSTDGVQISAGPLLDGIMALNKADNQNGVIRLVAAKGDPGISGSGVIAVIKLKAIAGGISKLEFSKVKLVDSSLNYVTGSLSGADVTVSTATQLSGLQVTSIEATKLKLSWNVVAGATRYNIYRSISENGPFSSVGTTQDNLDNSFNDSNLLPSTSYWYKVAVLFAPGESDQPGIIHATTLPEGQLDTSSLRLGLNPEDQESAGIFMGLRNAKDSSGDPFDGNIGSYKLEIKYDPTLITVLNVTSRTGQGDFAKVIDQVAGNVVVSGDGLNTVNTSDLVFVSLAVTGSVKDLATISVRFFEVKDLAGNVLIATEEPQQVFQRGKILSENSKTTISVKDAIAGLQYLVKIRDSGFDSGKVNIVNMASIKPFTPGEKTIMPSVTDIVAILQYLAGLRDDMLSVR